MVDEYGRLEAELAPLKGKLKRLDELSKAIRACHENADAEKSVVSIGDEYEVVLGPRGMQTSITDMVQVYKAMGRDKFMAYASITLKALGEAGIDAVVIASLTKKSQTGSRSLSARALLVAA